MKKLATKLLILILLSTNLESLLAQEKLPYQNPSLPIEKRVDDLVSRMTLEEKVSQMMNGAAAIERLGIPEYEWWNEALHGVARAGYATVFPQAMGLAATWNDGYDRLARSRGASTSSDSRGFKQP